MLELRPNCECCNKDLPPDSMDARICTYECTFCADCVEQVWSNVCPNCGGGFVLRPIRPSTVRRKGVGLEYQPASTKRVITQYSEDEIRQFAEAVKAILPEER